MKNKLFVIQSLIATLFFVFILSPLTEAISAGLEFGGSLRVRFENKKNAQFNEADKAGKMNNDDYVLSQIRLNMK